jgi:leader peptidase (prepilin peptidase)/N-methyltransferase
MSTPVWSAVGCAVAGAAVGTVLPAIADKAAHRCVGEVGGWWHGSAARIVVTSVTTALVMGVFGYRYQDPILAAWSWLTVTGVCLALVDIECWRLPRVLVIAMGVGGLLVFVTVAFVGSRSGALVSAIAAAGVIAMVAHGIALLAPGHVGGGDVRLYPVLGLYLGWLGWPTVLLGMFAGAAFTVALAVASRRRRVAAGPSLILGAFVAIALKVDAAIG